MTIRVHGPVHASALRTFVACACLFALAGLFTGCASTGQDGPVAASDYVPRAEVDTEERRRARIRLELAAGYYQKRNYSVALDELRQALTIDPDYAAAYGMLGLVYMAISENERAEQSFRKALSLLPDSAELNNNFGWFLCSTGRERDSLPYFDRAAKDPLYETPARPLHNAGICLRRVKEDRKALAYLQRAFQIDPGNPVVLYNLADIYLATNELDRAQFYSQRLVKGFESSAQVLWQAIRIAQKRHDNDTLSSMSARLQRNFPNSPEAERLSQGRFSD